MKWGGVECGGVEWGGVEWSGVEWSWVEWSGVELPLPLLPLPLLLPLVQLAVLVTEQHEVFKQGVITREHVRPGLPCWSPSSTRSSSRG